MNVSERTIRYVYAIVAVGVMLRCRGRRVRRDGTRLGRVARRLGYLDVLDDLVPCAVVKVTDLLLASLHTATATVAAAPALSTIFSSTDFESF